jgi:hypothetical protein
MKEKSIELNDNDFWRLDTDLYNLIQKHFKISLNDDEKLFNWYCNIRNKIEKKIVKQLTKGK